MEFSELFIAENDIFQLDACSQGTRREILNLRKRESSTLALSSFLRRFLRRHLLRQSTKKCKENSENLISRILLVKKCRKLWSMSPIEYQDRLRDVTPSHITSLNVTPSGLRTLKYVHFTFGKLHLWAASPSEYYTFGSYTFRCFTFGTFHLLDITTSQNYTFHSFWRRRKVKNP